MLGVRLKGTTIYAAEYDSTKEAVDELKKRVEESEADEVEICNLIWGVEGIIARLTALEDARDTWLAIRAILEGQITDLEAKVDAPEKPCERCGGEGKAWLQTKMWGEGVTKEICPECKGTGKQPPDTSAKVDAPRPRIAGAYYPITKQPPDTCGTCGRAWRRDDTGYLLCRNRNDELKPKSYNQKGCEDHKRRKA